MEGGSITPEGDGTQLGALVEDLCIEGGDTGGNGDIAELVAVGERLHADAGDTVGDDQIGQTVAVLIHGGSDGGGGVEINVGQGIAAQEATNGEIGIDALGHDDGGELVTVLEAAPAGFLQRGGELHILQAQALVEGVFVNENHAVGDLDGGQTGVAEGMSADGVDVLGQLE